MPLHLQLTAEHLGRWLYFIKYLIVIALILVWAKWADASFREIDVVSKAHFSRLPAILGATSLLALGRVAFQWAFPWEARAAFGHPLRRGPMSIWVCIFAVGGAVEEIWRGLSLVALDRAGWGGVPAILVTSLGFALTHLSDVPARLSGNPAETLWEALLGAVLGGLFLAHHTIAVPYVVGLCFNIFNLWFLRRTKGEAIPAGGA